MTPEKWHPHFVWTSFESFSLLRSCFHTFSLSRLWWIFVPTKGPRVLQVCILPVGGARRPSIREFGQEFGRVCRNQLVEFRDPNRRGRHQLGGRLLPHGHILFHGDFIEVSQCSTAGVPVYAQNELVLLSPLLPTQTFFRIFKQRLS